MIPFIIAGSMFTLGIVLYYVFTLRQKPINEEILNVIIESFLTRSFRKGDLANLVNLADEELIISLNELANRGIIRKRKGRYQIMIPLFFLDDRQYQKAMRFTANDEILYGAPQQPFLSHFHLFAFYGLIPLTALISIFTLLGFIPDISNFISASFWFIDIRVFFIFLILMSLIVVDAVENIVKSWAQERFSVIVGSKSGLYYDKEYASELSGRIQRGHLGVISMKISMLQKLLNYFSEVPHGDIIVGIRGRKKGITFRNMPFPRELFYVLRRVQLKGLGWRKRHARTLMMWRTKSLIPTVGGR